MYAIRTDDIWQEGCRNSQLLIADRVDPAGMFEFVNLMPRFPIPDEFDSENALFAHTVWEGMAKRFPGSIPDDRRKQADYEIEIIASMGFPAYFLVVADFINWAKSNGVAVGPGRGSAADISVAELMATSDDDDDRPAPSSGYGRGDGQIVKIGGILSGVTRKVTKKGDTWAAAILEDLGGAIEVLFFPNSYQLYSTAIAEDATSRPGPTAPRPLSCSSRSPAACRRSWSSSARCCAPTRAAPRFISGCAVTRRPRWSGWTTSSG
jgi:DNA polymerase III alpha subunit